MLCETKIQNKVIEWVVIGVGINVNESKDDFDSNIVNKASSLFIELGQNTQRERVVASILNNMELLLKQFENEPNNFDMSKDWNNYCIHNNIEVSFQKDNTIHMEYLRILQKMGHVLLK